MGSKKKTKKIVRKWALRKGKGPSKVGKKLSVKKARSSALRLEEGVRYLRRDGEVTEPLKFICGSFRDDKHGWLYESNGSLYQHGSETKHDLVAEYKLSDDLVAEYQSLDGLGRLLNDIYEAEEPPSAVLMAVSDSETKEVVCSVLKELEGARASFPPMASLHEAFSILLEECDELKAEVQKKQLVKDSSGKKQSNLIRTSEAKREAIQVAAMALRLILDCCVEGSSPSYGK